MRRGVATVVLAALAGCYQAPSQDRSCTIVCADSCPDDMACRMGYCVAAGETCEPTFQRVHAGNGFACALDEAQRRWCWGANDHHQIDASDTTQIVYATLISDSRWDQLATGGDHMCGLQQGELYCWGGNDHQQVIGGVAGDVTEPVRIASPNGEPWRFVETGYNSTCAMSDRLYCWGAGDRGQLGTGSTADVGVPTPIQSELTDWESVSLGRYHACAISRTGGLHCWGYNYYGQLGIGGALQDSTPMMPTPVVLPDVTSVAVAAISTCATAGGQLYCWGYRGSNVLGDPQLLESCGTNRTEPALSSGLTGWTRVSAAQYMTCGLRDNEVWCWGYAAGGGGLGKGVWNGNGWGRVTLGASDVSLGWNANVDESGDTQDLDLACIIIDGHVQCWGDNRYGQLAQGGATMQPTPREIAGNHRWTSLLASEDHTCGITDAHELYCWGTMLSGQTNGTISGTSSLPCGALPGVACTLGEPTPVPFQPLADEISLGDDHTCALYGTQLTCWGSNGSRQLGPSGTTSPYTVPGTWTGLYSVGGGAQCAVTNGETWCWGSLFAPYQPAAHDARLDGMRGAYVNATIGDATNRGSQRAIACVLQANDELACAGDNSVGQFGLGPPAAAVCGNFECEDTENATSCPSDCIGDVVCNTNSCTGIETCSTAYSICGDGRCNRGYGETCTSCAADCGTCPYQPTGRTYTAFAVGILSTQAAVCGVRPDGHVECWARNGSGQVGVIDTATGKPIDPVYTPYEIPGLSGCTAVGSGDATTCAICGGDIYCWGSNRRGTVGAGALTALPVIQPRKLELDLAGDRFVAITSGSTYSCAYTEQGRGYCWGLNRYGAMGSGATSANLPIDIKLAPSP